MADAIHVLILEDRHDDAEIMALELESDGFEVRWERVETPDAFLAHLSPDIHIILADYTLPQFNAQDALALLKARGLDIPFIVVTGSVSEEAAVACMKQGAADYLLKDRLSRLGPAVRHAIHQRDMGRVQREAEMELIILGHAVETSINAVVMTDLEGRIIFANRAVKSLWEFPSERMIIGDTLYRLLRPSVGEAHPLDTLKHETTTKGELVSGTQNGRSLILQYAANRVMDRAGNLVYFMFTFVDITEQKRAEGLRIQLERERDLRELRSRFVSMLVHDFRNPLASLQLSLSIIEDYGDRLTPAQVAERIHAAIHNAEKIEHLIDDVLLIGKMEHISSLFAPETGDLVAFCRTVFDEFQNSAVHPQHQFVFSADVPSTDYSFDRSLFRRALDNLLSNAVKYSPAGGNIKLALVSDESSIELSIMDEGIGIPAEDQKRIFDGFHRANNVEKFEGTGLGLAIVKQVVEVHGGTIVCRSEVNQGTAFTIRLPLAAPASAPAQSQTTGA